MRKFFTDRTPPSSTQLAGIYDAHAPTWLARESRAEARLTGQRWRDDLISALRGDVLEIGVAAGDTILRMRDYDHHVTSLTGIDLSPEMIHQAERAAEGSAIPVWLHTANAEDLQMFSDDAFDTVTASLVLCTIPDVPRALAEIARVLKPDGRVVLIEHVLSPNRLIAWGQRILTPWQVRYIGCHLDRTTVETLQQSGYRIEEERKRLFGIMRFVIARPPT